MRKPLIYKIMTYVTSSLAVILSFVFIALSIKLFYSPEKYTQKGAVEALLMALPLIIVFVLDVAVVGVYSVYKGYAIKDGVLVDERSKYQALLKIVGPQEENNGVLLKEKKIRLLILSVTIALCVFGCVLPYSIYFLNYAIHTLDGSKDPTVQVIDLLVHALPWLAISLCLGIASVFLRAASFKRSAKELTKALGDKQTSILKKEDKIALNVVRGIVIAAAIALIVVGSINGEASDVLKKASAICTECIGLG
ncbi:MAG: hypothetical protein MJ239_03930 [Bacilli bacterium]|nr:hypothetical protein [Bacilli bacterium]